MTDSGALHERAKRALRSGRTADAAAILRQALETPPSDAGSLRRLADVALVLQDPASASGFLDAAIAAYAPESPPAAWLRVLGETRAARGELSGAIQAFRAALAKQPDDTDTWRWLARVLRAAGDLPGAIAACRRAVASEPGVWPALGELATLLTETQSFDEATALFDQAAKSGGSAAPLIVGRAKLDAACGRRSQAIEALQKCVAACPGYVPAFASLALALRDERRFDESVDTFRRAVVLAPEDATLWCGLGRTLLEAGLAGQAQGIATAYARQRPGHAGALALLALAQVALGDEQGARRLIDHDRFVVRRRLPVPDGFASLDAFNAALAAVSSKHPTLHRAPLSHATAVGLHSGSLLIDPPPVIRGFEQALHLAVAEYCSALPDWPDHPFVARQPTHRSFDIWSVVMERGGYQVPHIHPAAWLSGVYYPQLPGAMCQHERSEGALVFGKPDRNFPCRVEPTLMRIRPQEGLLVLFPSYFFHHTVPFDADGLRISVAFDVLPTGPSTVA